jgi:hypothetical protein
MFIHFNPAIVLLENYFNKDDLLKYLNLIVPFPVLFTLIKIDHTLMSNKAIIDIKTCFFLYIFLFLLLLVGQFFVTVTKYLR